MSYGVSQKCLAFYMMKANLYLPEEIIYIGCKVKTKIKKSEHIYLNSLSFKTNLCSLYSGNHWNRLTDDWSPNAIPIAKAKAYKKGKAIVFELKLSETSTLLGYDLGKRTKKFVKKIGRANAAILPWCVSVENGQAKALNAKYYIALSYPLLDMGGFMGIATVPGAITKDLEKAFKK